MELAEIWLRVLVAQEALNQGQEVDLPPGLIGHLHVVDSRNRMLRFDIDRSLCLHYSFNPHFHVIAKTSLVKNYAKLVKMTEGGTSRHAPGLFRKFVC